MKKNNLNRETSPCTSAPEYNFSDCIENKIFVELGCRPFWISNTGDKPFCQHPSKYMDYLLKTYRAVLMNDEELIEEFGCLKPCTYMEYKVNIRLPCMNKNQDQNKIDFYCNPQKISLKCCLFFRLLMNLSR